MSPLVKSVLSQAQYFARIIFFLVYRKLEAELCYLLTVRDLHITSAKQNKPANNMIR